MQAAAPARAISLLLFAAPALGWVVAGTAGCVTTGTATAGYTVTLRDGRVMESSQKPVLNPKTGYYQFRERDGRDAVIRQDEVAKIEGAPRA